MLGTTTDLILVAMILGSGTRLRVTVTRASDALLVSHYSIWLRGNVD